MRLDVRRIETLKQGDKVIGNRTRVKVVKNKVSPPFRIAEFDILATGISKEGGVLDVGIEMGVIAKSGAFLRYGEELIGQGREAAKQFMSENPDMTKKIMAEVMEKIKEVKPRLEVGTEEHDEDDDTKEV